MFDWVLNTHLNLIPQKCLLKKIRVILARVCRSCTGLFLFKEFILLEGNHFFYFLKTC